MRRSGGIGHFGQNGTGSREQGGPGWQEADATRGPLEQLHAQLVLERAHLAAEGRL
jgi:hypothetical protein